MAFVISVLNQKGGCGKTTISINLARAFQLLGYSVTYIDSDPQRSARMWKAQLENENPELAEKSFPLLAIDQPIIHTSLGSISSEIIIVDGSPSIDAISASAIKASNLVVIPVQPSPFDIWATNTLVEMVKQRIELTDGKLKASFLASRVNPNTKFGKEITEILKQFELPIFETTINQSIDYSNMLLDGNSIFEHKTPSSPNYQKSLNLAKEIIRDYLPQDLIKDSSI